MIQSHPLFLIYRENKSKLLSTDISDCKGIHHKDEEYEKKLKYQNPLNYFPCVKLAM